MWASGLILLGLLLGSAWSAVGGPLGRVFLLIGLAALALMLTRVRSGRPWR